MVMKVERGTYRVEPVAMPNPFTIKGNNQRSLCNLRFGMFSKQGKPASIIPEIEIDDMWDPLDYSGISMMRVIYTCRWPSAKGEVDKANVLCQQQQEIAGDA